MAGPTYQQKREIFERHFLFGKLSAREIDALLYYSRVEHYPAGYEIYPKGSPGTCLMAVLRGKAKMSSVSPDGKEIVFNIIHPGEIFGEIGVLDGGERSADAVAMEDCELLVVNRRDFLPVLENHADICLGLIKILCQRLRQTSEQVEDVLFRHLESRIAKALLQHSEESGASGGGRQLHLSQSQLGHIVGASRESINKILQAMQRAGLIDLAKGSIVIRDQTAIEQLI